jgi:serine/threonine-protein kinase
MAKDPETRFRSMDEVLAALKRVGGAAMTATVSGVGATGEYRSMGISGGYSEPSGSGKTSSGPHAAISGSGAVPAPLLDPSGSGNVQKKGSKGILIGAVVGVAVLAGIVAMLSGGKETPKAAATAPSAVVAAAKPAVTAAPAPTVAAPAAPAQPQFVKLRVATEPDGASVKEDGIEQCSQTPCDLSYKGPDADPAKDHKLIISKPGYKVETRTVRTGDSPVIVKLNRADPVWTPPPRQAPAAQPKKDDDSIKGFKEVPY